MITKNDYLKIYYSQLLDLIPVGDAVAFREIYDRYSDLLYIFTYRKLKNESEAQDVVHDVFAWLWENAKQMLFSKKLLSIFFESFLMFPKRLLLLVILHRSNF